ncbi:MAG: prolipoprotein diacylglyceryl transferase [Magnetococcales bacterium]|nr:prolipoprotein diacylglyceryl transferase [Magnetococcales bacterium]NGZ04972.1 prolipoprotein diacylglyceryl transferase [Magnetococcales bacterium]
MYPILAHWGDITLHTYGFVMMITLFVIYFMVVRASDGTLLNQEQIGNISLLVVFSIWFGGAILHTLITGELSWHAFQTNLSMKGIQQVNTLAIGSFFTITLWGYCVWQRLPFWQVADLLVPYFVMGYGLQRTFGCFSAGCCHGIPTDLPWGVLLAPSPWGGPIWPGPVHPTQLYMGIPLLLASRWLLSQRAKLKPYPGSLTGLSMMLLFGINFLVTFWRADVQTPIFLLGMSRYQWGSLLLTLVGVGIRFGAQLIQRSGFWSSRYSD